jgi:GxxExxY protein
MGTDLIVEGKVIVELKSAEAVLTYLKLTGMKLEYLLNFGGALMKDGISRILNGRVEKVFVSLCLGAFA